MKRNFLLLLVLVLVFSCKTTDKTINSGNDFKPQFVPGPSTIIYKTKNNYNNLVPVILSEDKSRIVSFPAPSDIVVKGNLQMPAVLENGYLLDNRGINENVAFLKYTYEEYSKLNVAPNVEDLYNNIIDKDPVKEMCNCGIKSAFDNIEAQLNEIINNKQLHKICKTVKK